MPLYLTCVYVCTHVCVHTHTDVGQCACACELRKYIYSGNSIERNEILVLSKYRTSFLLNYFYIL